MQTLRWLHLSDIHFKGNEHYNTNKMRAMLIEKIKEIVSDKAIDFVFITGDLTYQGAKYEKAVQDFLDLLLKTTHIENSNLFIVPGNHDTKRNQLRTLTIKGDRADTFVFEKETVEKLKKDFVQYNSFYKKIKKEENLDIYKIVKKGHVNFLLMNTAITSGADDDEGNLVLIKDEFFKIISELKDENKCVNIALGHHPISYFTENSQRIIRHNFIDYNIDLYLCGHVHKAGYDYDINDGRNIPTYKCGACMVDSYATVTFLVGDLNTENKSGAITYYKWMEQDECWIIGGSEGRRAVDGKIAMELQRFEANDNFTKEESEEVFEDEFRRFIMKFHEKIDKANVSNININPKDIFDKFKNMKCNSSIEKQYASLSRYFPVVDEIMESSLLSQIEKESIPNIVITEYNKLIDKHKNGNSMMEGIVDNIIKEYYSYFSYSNTKLKTYIKILVYWTIYECDIFNDVL